MNIQELQAAPAELRRAADEIEAALKGLSPGTRALLGIEVGRRRRGGGVDPDPAGARRGVTHPNDLDQAIFNFLVEAEGPQKVPEIKEALTDKFPNVDGLTVGRSLKWLKGVKKVKDNGGKGRAMAYTNVDDDPELPVKTHTATGRRNPNGGATAKEAIILVLNELDPGDKIAPKDAYARAMEIFPDRFKLTSFGGVFHGLSKEEVDGKPIIQFEGKGKNRVYFRGPDKIPGGADMPEGAPPKAAANSNEEDNSSDEAAAAG